MAGPQFANIQTFSRKVNKAGQSVDQVIAEATRDPEFSTHVDAPAAPRVLLGDPVTFKEQHDAHVEVRGTVVMKADGTEARRAIRKDRHTLASIVMSYPVPRSGIVTDEDQEKLQRWERRNLEWLSQTYGDQLKVVLAHDDEEHPHLHAWLLADDPGADATTLHPGKLAKKRAEAEAKEAGEEPRVAVKLGNGAYREAMREWQEAYYQAVGAPEGLTRTGPKRRRLSRQQWADEKRAAEAAAEALVAASQERAGIEADRKVINDIRSRLDGQKAGVKNMEAAAKERYEKNEKVRRDLERRERELEAREGLIEKLTERVRKIVGAVAKKFGLGVGRNLEIALDQIEEELKPKPSPKKKAFGAPLEPISAPEEPSEDSDGPGF